MDSNDLQEVNRNFKIYKDNELIICHVVDTFLSVLQTHAQIHKFQSIQLRVKIL